MDILNKIVQLRLDRNWSEYELAERADITQSTISSWYRKNMIPTIASLSKICDAFGITLSQFFLEEGDNNVFVTDSQRRLLQQAAKLSPQQYKALLDFLETL